MSQTEARKILKDAPIMWRRINSIGIILDCNSTYATKLGYAKSEIIGKPIFEHVPKESWEDMNESLKVWFETGRVTDRKITFKRQDGSKFPGILQATSLYDEKENLIGSNTVIFDADDLNDEKISELKKYFRNAKDRLNEIKITEYEKMDENSKSEYNGLKKMFDMLIEADLKSLAK
ncbi:MAG: histidine kinase [Nitrosopumilales archaeon CG15_BIG_FIL_POST_REV_8_21_14_020_37_12]|nr:MAG: histidine kinase [Nitrosopumilales archaeon CG15_BIG_FIL_POST_REV_8_21_14_020_37_12]